MGGKGGGGSSTNTVQKADPWSGQQPFLKFGFEEAQKLYNTPGPNVYPNATNIPFSPQTEMALGLTEGRALQGSPLNFNAQNLINDTLQGEYLPGNPYLDSVYNRAADAVTRNYSQGVLPNIDSQFAGAGRYGSGAWLNQKDMAFDQLGRSLEGLASNLYGNDYARERGMQQQAATMAPTLANQDYLDFQQLGNVGGIVEGKAGETLADQINRYQYYQNLPETKLRNFMQNIQGTYGGTTSSTTTGPSNPLASGLGLGLTGISLADNLGLLGAGAAPYYAGAGGALGELGYISPSLFAAPAAAAATGGAGLGWLGAMGWL